MAKTAADFVHLHVHTQYSLLDGAIRLNALFKRAKEFGMDSVAITDHGTMFGTVDFYDQAHAAGIKPIIGCECYVAPRTLSDRTQIDSKGLSHLVLLAENQEGYRNLCKLASIAQLEGFYYKPRIDKAVLKEYSKGLIALSACLHGEIPMRIKEGDVEGADEAAHRYLEIFGEGNFFLEVQHNGIDIQDKVNEVLYDMSSRLSIPLVATNDCHYLDKNDVRAHEVLLCVQTGKTINDPDRFRFSTDQLYFKSKEEMGAYFSDYPEALANTAEIAERCNIEFDYNTYHFPQFASENGKSADKLFEDQAREGFEKKLKLIRGKNPDIDEKVYRDRLEYEVSVINDMGFPGYFLIVSDFIKWAKANNVPVGPGRGSAAGSIVAYSMSITDLDPIEHGLIFERFLNPARKSMPDIDVDFCINGREKVFNYVVDKYGGGDYVAQIITYGKLKTRAVLRDVGRALDIPLQEVDAIAKMVPDVLNISLDDALKQEPKIVALADQKPEVAELIKICRTLEGLPRHASTHAAGVVIGDKPLSEYLPLYKGKKGEVVTQFDMKRVEKIGLVKFDFLGLRNLTVIADALSMIEKQGKPPLDLSNLDFDDPDTYKLLCAGDTTGVFQLESSGMKDLLTRLRPASFPDVTALVALYRPGPLDSGMVDDFVERKHGRKKVEYLVPELEPIIKETYGVIVYQEQVMKIAGSLARYSMAEADDLRKAMGKKVYEILQRHRERFITGSVENNIPEDKATQIFDLMEKFGGYGFNKSHSAAYALIAYQTAYLKAHYPVEFMAALLTCEMNSIDGVVKFINECRAHDIPILPPDINESDVAFKVDNGQIRFGLVAVKNVGEGAIESIIKTKEEGGRFSSLFEFCERVDLRKVNKRVLESLIKCGAFDSTGAYRSRMMAALEDALDYGQCIQKEKADPQMGLFSTGDGNKEPINVPILSEIDEWDNKQLLEYEKESLGFYITGHPLGRFQETIEKFASVNSVTIMDAPDKSAVRFGGMVSANKTLRTKRGDLMAFVALSDQLGTVEITIFPKLYTEVYDLLVNDSPIFVQGMLEKDESSAKILADMIIPIESAEDIWTAGVHITIDLSRTEQTALKELREILADNSGPCQTTLHLLVPGKSETILSLPENISIKAGPLLKREVKALLGYDAVETVCSIAVAAPQNTQKNGFRKKGQ
ncbi:MAG: DNA polymerase III subunit alpha [Desulfobacterales bacterium]|nr:DNA polymerase III subunit alpha [Desulfobacterales bacterium]